VGVERAPAVLLAAGLADGLAARRAGRDDHAVAQLPVDRRGGLVPGGELE
jgi:hypothetical protein